MNLLIVEDDRNLRGFLRKAFREEGYATDECESGDRAIERALKRPYDCIVLDVMLPGVDGFEVVKELRRRTVLTPVLMLTARDEVGSWVRGLEAGADDYLPKPFDQGEDTLDAVPFLMKPFGDPFGDGGPTDARTIQPLVPLPTGVVTLTN